MATAPPLPGEQHRPRGASPQCCSAPRHRQREPDGSGAAGFMRMTELDEQRFGAGGRVPHNPRPPHSLDFANPAPRCGWESGLVHPCAHPWGFNCSFCGVILYKYIYGQDVGAGLGSVGKWGGRVLGHGIFITFPNKRMGAVGHGVPRGCSEPRCTVMPRGLPQHAGCLPWGSDSPPGSVAGGTSPGWPSPTRVTSAWRGLLSFLGLGRPGVHAGIVSHSLSSYLQSPGRGQCPRPLRPPQV